MQFVHIANWCTWLAHTWCNGLIWNYKNFVGHSLDFHLGSCKRFNEVDNVSGIFFYWYRILFWNYEICTISLFNFGWWYTLMTNELQISLYLGLTKMVNILQIAFSYGFSFKKILSFCLSLCLSVCLCLSHPFHYVYIVISSWNFQEWLPMIEVMSMQTFKVRSQKSRLQRSRSKLAILGP